MNHLVIAQEDLGEDIGDNLGDDASPAELITDDAVMKPAEPSEQVEPIKPVEPLDTELDHAKVEPIDDDQGLISEEDVLGDIDKSLPSIEETKEFCQEKLNKKINEILSQDQNGIISNLYHLTQLRIARAMASAAVSSENNFSENNASKNDTSEENKQEPQIHKTLESYMSERIQQMPADERSRISAEIYKLYQSNGSTKSPQQVKDLLTTLQQASYHSSSQRIQAQHIPAVIEILRSGSGGDQAHHAGCQRQGQGRGQVAAVYCLSEDDQAIAWFVAQVASDPRTRSKISNSSLNMLGSAPIAHYHGSIRADAKLTKDEIENQIAAVRVQVNRAIEKAKHDFLDKYQQCKDFCPGDECFNIREKITRGILQGISELSRALSAVSTSQDELDQIIDDPEAIKETMLKNFKAYLNRGYLQNLTEARELERIREEEEKKQKQLDSFKKLNIFDNDFFSKLDTKSLDAGPTSKQCGGKDFYQEIRNIRSWGLSDPRDQMRNADKNLSMNEADRKDRRVGKDFFDKLGIPAPWVRCNREPVKKIPRFSYRTAEKRVCCDETLEWRKLHYGFASFAGGLTCRGYMGFPYLAEVGIKIGLQGGINIGGGLEPTECVSESCVQARMSISIAGGPYAEAIAGLGDIQGTVSWMPYVTVRQCFSTSGNIPPATLRYRIGNVIFVGQVRIGWTFSYDIIRPVYESQVMNSHEIAIF